MDAETFLFRRFLYQISNGLSGSEVNNLKFMLNESLPRRQLEDALSGFDILCLMEEKGFLSPDNLDLLKEILEMVGKSHLVQQYLSTRTSLSLRDVIKPIPDVNPSVNHHPRQQHREGLVSSHKKLLSDLAGELSAENVHDMALFFHGGNSSVHVRDLDKLKTAESVFKKLEGSRTIREGNYTILYNVIDVIGRLDLCEAIAQHCHNQSDGVKSPVPALIGIRPQQTSSLNTSYYSGSSSYPGSSYSSPSLESKDGVYLEPSLIVGTGEPSLIVGTGFAISHDHHPSASVDTSASADADKITQLEEEKKRLNDEIALLKKQSQARTVPEQQGRTKREQQLEETLRRVTTELERARRTINSTPTEQRPSSYDMKASPHGIALVMVNQKFDRNPLDPDHILDERHGAPNDRILLKTTFKALNYVVKDNLNLTSEEIRTQIEEALKESESENADSFVCCVSTHGNADGLFGSDSVLLRWEEINVLATQYLHGKPKMFFFQSCRKPHIVKADGLNSSQVHEDADIYKVYACTPNKEAYLASSGSWLASSLKKHFTDPQLMHAHNLQVLITYVADEVDGTVGTLSDGQEVQQCIHTDSTLRKSVYFFPQ